MRGWLPVHLHCIPDAIWRTPLKGMVLSAEWRPQVLEKMFGVPCDANDPFSGLMFYLEHSEALRPADMQGLPMLFSAEGVPDFGDPGRLVDLRNAGLQAVQLYHQMAECRYISAFSGVSGDGRVLLRAMAEADIFLDISHLHGALLQHVLGESPCRKIASHIVCEALLQKNIARRANAMSDAELVSCGAELFGVPFVDDLVGFADGGGGAAAGVRVDDVAMHILHLADVVGVERVCLGPDYFAESSMAGLGVGIVEGMAEASGLKALFEILRLRGMSTDEVEGVFWVNAWHALFEGRWS